MSKLSIISNCYKLLLKAYLTNCDVKIVTIALQSGLIKGTHD